MKKKNKVNEPLRTSHTTLNLTIIYLTNVKSIVVSFNRGSSNIQIIRSKTSYQLLVGFCQNKKKT